ncbi:MAG TPA: methyl-accepting chemotaxis protein [Candidatus Angelobacter sp.]|nr:methyl-accepting chemotaxis protein [Candidatus Angelobacter sp.]
MEWTIKRKVKTLLWAGLVGMIILSVFIFISNFTQRVIDNRISKIDTSIINAKGISATMEHAREFDRAFVANPSSKEAGTVEKDIKTLKISIKQLQNQSGVNPKQIAQLNQSVTDYDKEFQNFKSIVQIVGYTDDQGAKGVVKKSDASLAKLVKKIADPSFTNQFQTLQIATDKFLATPTETTFSAFSNSADEFDKLATTEFTPAESTTYNSTMLDYKNAIQSLNSNYSLSGFLLDKFNKDAGTVQSAVASTINQLSKERTSLNNQQSTIQTIILVLMVLLSLLTIISLNIFGTRLIKSIGYAIDVLKNGAERMGQGQLNYRVPLIGNDELTDLARTFNQMAEAMEDTIIKVTDAVDTLTSSSQNLAAISEETTAQSIEVNEAIQQVAAGAQTQAEHLEDGMDLIQNVTEAIEKTASLSDQIHTQSDAAQNVSKTGLSVVTGLEESSDRFLQITKLLATDIQEVANQSKEITSILKIIQDISKNTDLLALNAAIESARAGEAGRGFAVVSQEIRKLAERSKKETSRIQTVIHAITNRLTDLSNETIRLNSFSNEQEQNVKETKQAFSGIADYVSGISEKVGSIQDAVTNVTHAAKDLTTKLEEISAISEETAASTEQVSASSEAQTLAIEQVNLAALGLQDVSFNLEKAITQFDLETVNEDVPFADPPQVEEWYEIDSPIHDVTPEQEAERALEEAAISKEIEEN